jgi:sarcosine oxidase
MTDSTATRVDVVVIGGGAMGSAAAWQLGSRGREVVLLERFAPGHKNGASHGASRNFNLSYADPDYLALLQEALPLWRRLESETGERLLDQVGIVNHGGAAKQGDEGYDAVAAALEQHGFDTEFVDPVEAGRRWPGIRFDSRVLFTPQAGRLNADAAVRALQTAAADHGARVAHHRRVIAITPVDDDHVAVRALVLDRDTGEETGEAELFDARRVVVALGAWTTKLLGGVLPLPRLVVTQEQPAHFAVRDPDAAWPGFNHAPTPGDPRFDFWPSPVYGMLTPGEGVKAGWHGVGPVTDPDARTFRPDPGQLELLRRYVREWLPGADAEALTEISCTYTTSPDANFVIDSRGPVTVAAGFSGHGFKFTPAVGALLADLVEGTRRTPALFSLGR